MPRRTSPPSTAKPSAVLYARVSSKEQDREGFSIPAQRRLLQQYADAHEIPILREFVDVETAKRAGRTSFGEMVRFLRKHPACKAVLVEKTDRLYRNLKDFVELDGFPGLEIHLVKEGTVLTDDSRSSEKFIHGIKVLMAKSYIDNLSEETRKGMTEKARQGIWPSRAPLGYRNTQRPDGKRVIEPDPEVAPQVARLFEWYASGEFSLKTLTRKAKDEGVAFRKSGKPVPRSTVHKILQNPLYIGEFDWAGVRYQGIHDPVVGRELFQRVQDLLHGRATNSRRTQKREFAFSGLLSCALCAEEGEQRLLIGSLAKKKYIYYHCERCKQLKRAKYHPEAKIDDAVVRSLRTIRLDQEVMGWLTSALRDSRKQQSSERERSLKTLQNRYDSLQRKIDRAYEDRLDGAITIEYFAARSGEWRAEQQAVRARMARIEAADQDYIEAGITLLELGQSSVELYESQIGTEKRRLLGTCYSNCLWDGERLQIHWKQPFGMLAEAPKGSPEQNGPGEDSEARFEKWLPNRVHSDNSERAVLMTWVVEERIPPVPRRKPRRRRRAQRRKRGTQDAAAASATQAGHAKSKRGGGTSATGPRKARAGQASGPPVDRWTVALGRVRAALDRADGWQAWIDAEPGRTAADLARKEELSRARVCQVLKLRRLSREVVDDIRREGRSGPVPSEADMRRVAGLPVRDQWERYAEMVDELRAAKRRGPAMPRTDYRFDLRRARVWRAELEADDRLTLADIARREGYTSGRVSQVLNLLELAPEILAVLDVEEDKLPKGLLRKEIRRIAWMREHEEQRAEFERLWPGVLGTSAAET